MEGAVTMAPPQQKYYSEKDYYNMPEDIRAELVDGQIYYQAGYTRKSCLDCLLLLDNILNQKVVYTKFTRPRLLLNFLKTKIQY